MRKFIITISLCLLLFSCSNDKIETVEDNISEKMDITSVAESNVPELTEGNKLFINGQIDEAIAYYKKGIKSNRSLAYYNIGVSYYLLNNYKKSEEYFRLAISEKPDFEQALVNLAASLLHLDNVNEADTIIQNIIKSNTSAKVLVNAGNISLKKGNTAQAFYYFEKANDMSPELPFVKLSYGNFLISIGEYQHGIEILNSFENKDYNTLYNLAQGYFVLNHYEESIKMIKKALNKEKTIEGFLILADNYYAINDFTLAAEAFSWVIKFDNSWEYRFKYAEYLFLSGDWQLAKKILNRLIKERPKAIEAYESLYAILDRKNFRKEALDVGMLAYKKIGSDRSLYLYAREVLLHSKKYSYLKPLIFVKRESDYLQLARSLYSIKQKKYKAGLQYLSQIKEVLNNDFYVYRAFINIKNGKYSEALLSVNRIDPSRYEYLWFNFVIYWNMKNREKIIETVQTATRTITQINKRPDVTFLIQPVISDLDFSYRFNGDTGSFIRVLMTPQTINPDEMLSFLALGYKLLEDNEKLKALSELKKSVVFSNGIEMNNDGVSAFFQGDYEKALKLFVKSNKLTQKNPLVLYNIGVVWLNMGDMEKAYEYFDKSVLFNRFMFPAYLGKATILEMKGETEKTLFEYDNILNNVDIFADSSVKVPASFLYSKYLAQAGLGKYDEAIKDILTNNDDNNYLKGLAEILSYIKTGDPARILNLKKYSMFRKDLMIKLVGILNNQDNSSSYSSKDRMGKYLINYAKLYSNIEFSIEKETDKVLMKEKVLSMILLGKGKEALAEMRRLTRLHFKYSGLYKSSYYYFIWKKDFLNAEASSSSLARLNKKDMYTDYYRLLFFLLNYNEKRLHKYINSYIEKHPVDPRGLIIDSLNAFKGNRLKRLYNNLLSLEQLDPDFMEKISLVIDFESL